MRMVYSFCRLFGNSALLVCWYYLCGPIVNLFEEVYIHKSYCHFLSPTNITCGTNLLVGPSHSYFISCCVWKKPKVLHQMILAVGFLLPASLIDFKGWWLNISPGWRISHATNQMARIIKQWNIAHPRWPRRSHLREGGREWGGPWISNILPINQIHEFKRCPSC